MDNKLLIERINNLIHKFWQHAQAATSNFRHQNAIAPLSWSCIWFSLPCFLLSFFTHDLILKYCFFGVGLLTNWLISFYLCYWICMNG